MKKTAIAVIMTHILLTTVWSQTVTTNSDTPLKGDWDFQKKQVWKLDSAGEDPLVNAVRFRVDENGNIFIFDHKYSKFFLFDAEGRFQTSFGRKGEGPGEIRMLLDFHLVADTLIVNDFGKLHYFKKDGSYEQSVHFGQTPGLTPLFFLDSGRFVHTPSPMTASDPATTIEIFNVDGKNSTKVVDLEPGRKSKAAGSPEGGVVIRIGGSGDLKQKGGIVVAPFRSGLLWGKSDDYLIRQVDLSGKTTASFSLNGRQRKEITTAFKEKLASRVNIRIEGGAVPRDLKKRLMDGYSDVSTYFHKMSVHNGLIYVYISDLMRENGQQIDIFSPEGRYLYRADIHLQENERFRADGLLIQGDFLYTLTSNEDGEVFLVKYSIIHPRPE